MKSMINTKLQVNGALLLGPVIPISNVVTGDMLCAFPENRERLILLAKSHRLRRHSDGWFVDGRAHRSQIWEFGIARLGLTVTGTHFVNKCPRERSWLYPKCIGSDEANFWCIWTDANLGKLDQLVALQVRKRPNP